MVDTVSPIADGPLESGSWRNALISHENAFRYLRFQAALMKIPELVSFFRLRLHLLVGFVDVAPEILLAVQIKNVLDGRVYAVRLSLKRFNHDSSSASGLVSFRAKSKNRRRLCY
ncbi:hypothetical protein KG088_18960 [Halomonas sp. TRM85114]|uniref:hypothetical protein n=1 Tax=Halomonas jincaotanensis TaxID=2810616 RepID=UPI001BD3E378|nr:hypothetical protein [Halomonas jincaotanensis]MBS9405668.1 hypothetical protein [Halomonas jincaotanensis]